MNSLNNTTLLRRNIKQEFIMTKSAKNQEATVATRLRPTVVSNTTEVGDIAFDGKRKRPILAINDDGELVVCCRATARIKGWEVQGALHVRPDAAPADTPRRRKTDAEGAVVLDASQAKAVKSAITDAAAHLGLEDLLAAK